MKELILMLALAMPFSGRCQNNVLGQLGAKGVTEVGGTSAYAHYLVRLGPDGKLSTVMLPSNSGQGVAGWNACWIDSVQGIDATNSVGNSVLPYKTLAYAASNYAFKTNSGVIYIFAPGTYATTTLDALTYPGYRNIMLMGSDSQQTYLPQLRFLASAPGSTATVTVVNMRVGTLTQGNNKGLTVRMYERARIDYLELTYPVPCTVYRDSMSSIGTASQVYTNSLLETASNIGYSGTTATNVQQAIDRLYLITNTNRIQLYQLETNGMTRGNIVIFDGVNWVNGMLPWDPTNVVTLTSSLTVTSDVSVASSWLLTLTSDVLLLVPTNGLAGARAQWKIEASGADRNVTLDTGFSLPASAVLPNPFTISSGTATLLEVEKCGTSWWLRSYISGYTP